MARGSLRRIPGTLSPKERMVILTEGEATEVEYFTGIRERFGVPKELVSVRNCLHTDARGIVNELVEAKRLNARNAKRGREPLVEQWWGVVDTEGSPSALNDAIQKARANGVYLAISDLSFEYWLLLHFGYTTAEYDSVFELIRALRRKGLSEYSPENKHPDMDVLYPLLPDAMSAARRLRKNHTRIGNGQPRTDCDLLVDAIAAQADPSVIPYPAKRASYESLSMNCLAG